MTTTDDAAEQLAEVRRRLEEDDARYAGRSPKPSATAPIPREVWS